MKLDLISIIFFFLLILVFYLLETIKYSDKNIVFIQLNSHKYPIKNKNNNIYIKKNKKNKLHCPISKYNLIRIQEERNINKIPLIKNVYHGGNNLLKDNTYETQIISLNNQFYVPNHIKLINKDSSLIKIADFRNNNISRN